MEAALEAGADDFQRNGDSYELLTDPTTFNAVLDKLKTAGYQPTSSELSQLAKTLADVETEVGKKVLKLIDVLEDNDDVQNVYTNANITEEMAG